MKQYVAIGLAILAGAAVVEAALIPGLVIGGAAMLVPKVLPTLRRRVARLMNGAVNSRSRPAANRQAARSNGRAKTEAIASVTTHLPALGIKQAIAKTITFRV